MLQITNKSKLKMDTNEKIIVNEVAYRLGKVISGADRRLISEKLSVTREAVCIVLSGTRRAHRGKSLQIVELAKKIADINARKADIM